MEDRKELQVNMVCFIVIAILVLVSAVYIIGLTDYDKKFCNSTYINGIDVSNLEVYDTYGDARPFTTSGGQDITISGGSYGWLMHRTDTANKLIDTIKAGTDATIEPVYSFKALIRDTDDIGNTYVEISIKDQMVWVYKDGVLEVETPTVTGNTSKKYDTPTGIYPLTYKTRNATLRGPGYASPVSYWMPFNMGVGLHDATWRSEFGGDIYKTDGSHGCINLPKDKAAQIYDIVYAGMPIIVY